MVNMGVSRYSSSIVSRTNVDGVMGGPASNGVGILSANRSAYKRANHKVISKDFMLKMKLLSKNPAGSGGIGKKVLVFR